MMNLLLFLFLLLIINIQCESSGRYRMRWWRMNEYSQSSRPWDTSLCLGTWGGGGYSSLQFLLLLSETSWEEVMKLLIKKCICSFSWGILVCHYVVCMNQRVVSFNLVLSYFSWDDRHLVFGSFRLIQMCVTRTCFTTATSLIWNEKRHGEPDDISFFRMIHQVRS